MADDREFWDRVIRERGSRAFDTLESKAASDKAEREIDAFLLARMHGVSQGRILEIGCGRGRMTQVLAQLFETVVALDVSREATRRCRAAVEASKVLVVLGDDQTVAAMPSDSFDVVFSYATFQHVSSRSALQSYVASAARLVAPSGIAVLQLRHPGWKARVVDWVVFAASSRSPQQLVSLMARHACSTRRRSNASLPPRARAPASRSLRARSLPASPGTSGSRSMPDRYAETDRHRRDT